MENATPFVENTSRSPMTTTLTKQFPGVDALKIVFLCVAAAIVYGILHDQVTARVCVEYFTMGHQPVFRTESPTLLALGWGVLATWWVGLFLGLLAAAASRLGSWPKYPASGLLEPVCGLFVVVACASLAAGLVGFHLAQAGETGLDKLLPARLPGPKRSLFVADVWAHLAGYGAGAIGGILVCYWVLFRRWQAEARRFAATTPAATGLMPLNQWRWGTVFCFVAVLATTPFNLVLWYFCIITMESVSVPIAKNGMILVILCAALHVGLFAVLWAGGRYVTRKRPAHVGSGMTVLLTVLYLSFWLGWSAWAYVAIMLSDH